MFAFFYRRQKDGILLLLLQLAAARAAAGCSFRCTAAAAAEFFDSIPPVDSRPTLTGSLLIAVDDVSVVPIDQFKTVPGKTPSSRLGHLSLFSPTSRPPARPSFLSLSANPFVQATTVVSQTKDVIRLVIFSYLALLRHSGSCCSRL